MLNKKRLVIESSFNFKKDFIIKNNLDQYSRLEYFFNIFLEYRNKKGRYPTLNNWREYIVTVLLDNLSKNNSLAFNIDDLSSNKKLKDNIYKYQKNIIFLYDLGFSYILKFFEDNEIILYEHIIEGSYEILKKSIKKDFFGLSKSSEIELHLSNSLNKLIKNSHFEIGFIYSKLINNLETELFLALERFDDSEYDSLFSLDKILLNIGYTISAKNIVDNLSYFKELISKEECIYSERLNCKNVISYKYCELSNMLLAVLTPAEKNFIKCRYGFGNVKRNTLKEIYEIKRYKSYKKLIEDLIKILWKLKITWPSEILYKLLFGRSEDSY